MNNIQDCFLKTRKNYLKFLKKEKIFNKSTKHQIKSLKSIYIPLSFWIEKQYTKKGKTLFLGLSGGQGSGKTTVSGILKIILKFFFKRKVHVSSIDDFYKTLQDRDKMSKTIHPLFKIRGVPGTHEVKLLKKFFIFLKRKKFKKLKLPKFDKSMDDRLKQEHWISVKKKPDIVILEGWCVGAKPQKSFLLKKPVNILEKYEDTNCIWRKYANEQLKREYKKIFSMIDHFIFIKIPNFNMVFKWRYLQEEKLRKRSRFKKRIMSIGEIKRFIMCYERITLQMLKDLAKSASIVIMLNKTHEIKRLIFRDK